MTPRVAILGATGLVGRTMLALLEARGFPVDAPVLLASDRAGDRTVPFRGRPLAVHAVSDAAFEGVDFALFGSANEVSRQWAPAALRAGAHVIDNSSAFRYDPDVPLVVPEVNGRRLDGRPPLVANPNCSTIGIVMVLDALERAAGLERVVVSTYQSISGAGSQALEAFESDVRSGLDGPPTRVDGTIPTGYNVVPHIDRFEDNGYTREEMKVVWETRKILELPELPVSVTAVRVPVRVGHCAAITASLRRPLTPDEARALWADAPGVRVVDDPAARRYPTPLESEGQDDVLVGRVRRDLGDPRALALFVASDNLRKGAALNAVQIAERMLAAGVGSRA